MSRCLECAGALAADQRYCLACGARAGAPLPMLLGPARRAPAVEPAAAPTARAPFAVPSPAIAGAAMLAMIGVGVLAGNAASPRADATLAASRAPIVIDVAAVSAPAPAAEAAPPSGAHVAAGAGSPAGDRVGAGPDGTTSPAPIVEPVPSPATDGGTAPAATTPDAPDAEPTPTATTPDPEPTPTATTPDDEPPPSATAPDGAAVPPLTHVWVLRLAQRADQLPSLAALRAQGGWLAGYRPLGDGGMADVVGLLSGQDACGDPAAPCAFDPDVQTVLGQLDDTDRAWRAYLEDHPGPPGCRTQPPTPGDPLGAFASLAEATSCVPLTQLDADLGPGPAAPALSLVLPGLAKIDPAVADPWLADTVAKITATPVYADGGTIVVTLADGALVLSKHVAPGTVLDAPTDAFALLRTLQDAFGLPTLGRSADSSPYGRTLWTAWSQDVHAGETSS